jgi:hypothetical protein
VEDAEAILARSGRRQPRQQGDGGIGKVVGEGRRAMLVGDDAQLRPFLAEAQHGLDEVVAMRRADPGGAEGHAARLRQVQQQLAGELGGAVDADRRRRVRLGVGAALDAVEDIVGRVVDHRHARPRRRLAEQPWPGGIHREGQRPVVLGAVDGGIGRGVDHRLRPVPREGRLDLRRIGQVELRRLQPDGLMPRRRQPRQQLGRDLAGAADDEDAHQPAVPAMRPSRSPPYFWSRSGRHHHSLARYQSMVAAMPLSKLCCCRQPSSRSILPQSMA